MNPWKSISSILLILAGCAAGKVSLPTLTAEDAASPEAREANLPAASQTLAISDVVSAAKLEHAAVDGRIHGESEMHPAADPAARGAAPASSGETPTQFTCPMHPEIVSDQPGKCPKCGMKLVEKKVNPKEGGHP